MFTVVIPLYNKEQYIVETIHSVLKQTFKEFELLVINDGSTDNSLKRLKSIEDDRLKIINQTNQGVGAARNAGFQNAKFDWIAFLDADDYWSPVHLNELYKVIQKYPSSGMVATQNKIVDIKSRDHIVTNHKENYKIRRIDYFAEAAKKLTIVHSSSVAIKKQVYESIGGFSNHTMGEDLEYWARAALAFDVAISEKPTSYYCIGTGGASELSNKYDYIKPKGNISSLEQVSPTLMLLVHKSQADSSLLKQKSIRSYINSTLYSGVKIWLYHENFQIAKELASLSMPQLTVESLVLNLLPKLPVPLLKIILGKYKKINNIS